MIAGKSTEEISNMIKQDMIDFKHTSVCIDW